MMFTKMHNKRMDRKAQVFVVGIVIAVTAALLSSYIMLNYLFKDKSNVESLGSYESGMVDTLQDADKTMLYVDTSASIASENAMMQFGKNGGMMQRMDSEYVPPGDGSTDNYCGRYVYNLWNNYQKDCYPDYKLTLKPYLDEAISAQTSKASSNNPPDNKNVLNALATSINYAYEYYPHDGKTSIYGFTQDTYDMYITSKSAQTSTSQSGQSISTTPTQSDMNRIAKTKIRLQNLKTGDPNNPDIYTYVVAISKAYGVPEGVVLGLITQESGGNMNADSGLAYGLMQVTLGTFTNTKFNDKCSWEQYKIDARCQVRAGVAILRQNYDFINGRTWYYSCTQHCQGYTSSGKKSYYASTQCKLGKNSCTNTCIGPVSVQYTGWEAALRYYNGGGWSDANKIDGSGCSGQPDYQYVDKVMKYANAWGYIDDSNNNYASKTQADVNNGVFGTYSFSPDFTTDMDFDLTLLDKLKEFAKDTLSTCASYPDSDKDACLQGQIATFNKDELKSYVYNGQQAILTTICDDTTPQKEAYDFATDVDNCFNSPDDGCQCVIGKSGTEIKIASTENYTTMSYTDDLANSVQKNIYMDYSIATNANANANLWSTEGINIRDISLFKSNSRLNLGQQYSSYCTPAHNRFKLCLKTGYPVPEFQGNKLAYNDIAIRFAIQIRDNIPPTPVNNIEIYNEKHSKDNIMLLWSANPEKDVVKYKVYLGDSTSDFTGARTGFYTYRTLSSINQNYDDYTSIDYMNPICEMKNNNGVDYCVFDYKATDKNGNDKDASGNELRIQLTANKLYHIKNGDKFLYILDGSDPANHITKDQEKFIAITAVDVDGNEISNLGTDSSQKITPGKNLVSITPKDSLEAGFVKITSDSISGKTLSLSWDKVNKYIDYTDMTDTPSYEAYIAPAAACDDKPVSLKILDTNILTKYSDNKADIDISKIAPGNYCVGVTASGDNGLEYDETFVKSMIVP